MTEPSPPAASAPNLKPLPVMALGRFAVSAIVIAFVVTVLYRFSLSAIGAGLVFVLVVEAGLALSERIVRRTDRRVWVARSVGSAILAGAVTLGFSVLLQIDGHALLALIGSLTAYVLMVLFSPLIASE